MDPEAVLDRLVDSAVLAEAPDGDSLTLADRFRETLAEERRDAEALDDDALGAAVRSVAAGRVAVPETRGERVEFLAAYRALSEHLAAGGVEERLRLLPVLEQFSAPPARSEGAPDAFTPVTGRQLTSHLRTNECAIVYVWREDCPPCDLTVEDLDAIFPAPPEDVALLAIYGPGHPDVMDEYGVVGAPTLLFFLDGAVDVRLQGPQYREVIENELEKLRERR